MTSSSPGKSTGEPARGQQIQCGENLWGEKLAARIQVKTCLPWEPYPMESLSAEITGTRHIYSGFPGGSDSKDSACNAGDPTSIPELGRSPGGGNGNPPQYSCLENPMDGGAWRT